MSATTWAILTGEYPPMPGGVADHTRQLAVGLAGRGRSVHVWVPSECDGSVADHGVRLHRLPDHFAPRGLQQLEEEIAALPTGTRLVVQYVPHAFGFKAMNLPFCAAVERLAQRWPVDVMFHEVAMPVGPLLPLRWNFIGLVNRVMARLLVKAAERLLVSTSAWCPMLEPLRRRDQPILLAPVPSNIPPCRDGVAATAVRARVGGRIVGHFGSCHPLCRDLLAEGVRRVLQADNDTRMLWIGGSSSDVGGALHERAGELADRMIITGRLDATAVAAHLAACDVMVQPYPDGLSTRRSSAMAALCAGIALVSTRGSSTETLWNHQRAVTLVEPDPAALAEAIAGLLSDDSSRRQCGAEGRRLYESHFCLDRTLDVLLER
ncbi:MAG: glycosyltransferase family 4 protein [Phycisphaerae bacterium]|nr:glycosyltransferase family 4 protein [Phycisphaerae bacterium]MDW8261551.1 glycosyltransferase family 4 protein [Phycisphaerales bacterium]